DRWHYSISSDGEFSVKDTRSIIDDMFLPSHDVPTRWVKGVPGKINIFTWKARRDVLPTRYNLIRRDGGNLIGINGLLFRSGSNGFLISGYLLKSKVYLKEFSWLLGGLFGAFGIEWFLSQRLQRDRCFSMTSSLCLIYGAIIDVIGRLIGILGLDLRF
ncbi:hypothetical protein Tco_1271584, partial [Tanacetum coccineum]